ncbi:MAG: Fe-S cluster assembly protein SufD [Rhodothermales bacterium]|nr:Fe-S cluster assembly protein SufD [Rhodothermales bacterium]
MPTTIDREQSLVARFVQAFEMNDGHTLNGTNARLHGLRKDAIGHVARLGFPGRKDEAWKYTNIGKVLKRAYALPMGHTGGDATRAEVDRLRVPGLDAYELVLADGRFREDLSALGGLPEGVFVTGFARAAEVHADLVDAHAGQYAKASEEVFTALNTAFAQDGAFVYVPENVVLDRPIHVMHLVRGEDTATMIQPRLLIVAERGAQLRLVQTSEALGANPVFLNAVTEVYVGHSAHVDLYEIQDDHAHASAVNTLHAYQAGPSVFRTSTFTFSGEVIRNNVTVHPDAEGCEAHLYGLFLGDGAMHVDNHTLVDHAVPACFSNELYKGVLDDRATGVFNGKVFVRQDAQQTNAYQSNKSILLSETAQMYSKPELEIYADDVQCSHGATTGQLDREGLFYLRSRGLSEAQARALMLTAFAGDVLETVRLPALRDHLDALVAARFGA